MNVRNAVCGVPLQPAGSLNCGMHALVQLEGYMKELCIEKNDTITPLSKHLPEGFWRTTGTYMTSEATANLLRYEMFTSLYKHLRPLVENSSSDYKPIVLHHLDRMRGTLPLAPYKLGGRRCMQLDAYPPSLFHCTL
jgi:hypothetical protein